MPSKQSRESRRAIRKRVLEAQKVVLSEMLWTWQNEHGMAYAIIVWNEADDVFVRVRIDEADQADEIQQALSMVIDKMNKKTVEDLPVRIERSKARSHG